MTLLWTYYEPRLGDVENGLRSIGVHPLRLEPDPPPTVSLRPPAFAAVLGHLRSVVAESVQFDRTALAFVMSLDRALHRTSRAIEGDAYVGIDGRMCQLWRRNNFVADTYELRGDGVTWVADQGRFMAAYAPHVLVLPVERAGEIRVESRRLRELDRFLDSRLWQERARGSLRIMLWPLTVHIDYPALDELSGTPPPFISLRDPRNEGALQEEVVSALSEAQRRHVTVLIFPELAIPPSVEATVKRFMANAGGEAYPLLTVLPLCHARLSDEPLDVNEAVLLGPGGTDLFRHRKVSPFSVRSEYPCGERIRTGDMITVLESAIGNITLLICLDLFHERVRGAVGASHANLFLVPSLSGSTTAHRTRATDLGAVRLASTFVSNRHLVSARSREERARGASFYRVPRREGEVCHELADGPYLLFDL